MMSLPSIASVRPHGTALPVPATATALPMRHDDGQDPLTAYAHDIDRFIQALMSRFTGGLAPSSLAQALADWAIHSAFSPGRQYLLATKALRKQARFADLALRTMADPDHADPAILPMAGDRRFADPAWRQPPYNLLYQGFLFTQQWWHNATTGVGGVTAHHEAIVSFMARQLLDIWSPSNWLLTNPAVQNRTVEERGLNLLRGGQQFAADTLALALTGKTAAGASTKAYAPGKAVALTPGKVVYRNRLIELIQYAPTTGQVHPEPILIVPAWIMKYYILDLEPHNSLIRYLTAAGFTVFTISWHNPDERDRDIHLEDYRASGFQAAFDAVIALTGAARAHVAGYCLGGTLATIGAATLGRAQDERLASLTLLAAQTDFTEPGELALFISAAQVEFLEAVMWARGYLDSSRMSGAFQLLRSSDLIWSRMVTAYLMGEREQMNALTAWNADGTRMPLAMHSEYLRHLFLENALVEGHYMVEGRPIAINDIRAPIFAVGTEQDHIAPWKSVYKINLLADSDVTFCLASGGHNVGIVADPGFARSHHRVATHRPDQPYADPEQWRAAVPETGGSWWPAWVAWLQARSGQPVAPPPMGPDLGDAPGSYVFE